MSFLGKVLAVLNLAALLGFVYMATADLQMRQAWSYAVFRWDVALDGMPIDKTEVDQRGRLRYLNFGDALSAELVGDPKILTQEQFLDSRRDVLLARIDDPKVKPLKLDMTVEVLVALTDTLTERESLLNSRSDKTPANLDKLRKQLEAKFASLKEIKDQEAKKLAMGRALVAMLDLLPTDKEKEKRAEDLAKPADQRADPAANPVYRQTANALGVRTLSRALDEQAKEYLAIAFGGTAFVRMDPQTKEVVRHDKEGEKALTIGLGLADLRKHERISFAYAHQSLLGELMNREHQLQDQKDKLAIVQGQAKDLERLAGLLRGEYGQEDLVKDLRDELVKKRDATDEALKRLSAEQERLYFVRLRLRDANQTNQNMERAIRKLENEIASENP